MMNQHITHAPLVKIEPRDDWPSSLAGPRCGPSATAASAFEAAPLRNSRLHPTAMQYMHPSSSQYSLQHAELVQKHHINGIPRMPLHGLGLASYAYSDASANASAYLIEERPRNLSSDMRMAGPASMAPCPTLPPISSYELAHPPASYSMHTWQQDQKPFSTPAMSPLNWSPQSNPSEVATHTALLESNVESSPASSSGVSAGVVAGYRFPAECSAREEDQATLGLGTVNPLQMSDSSGLLQVHGSPASATHEVKDGLHSTSTLVEDREATYRPSQLAQSMPTQQHKRAPLPSAFTDAYAFPATLRYDQSSSSWFSEPAALELYTQGLLDGVTVPSERSTWSVQDEKPDVVPLVGTALLDQEGYPFAQYRSLTPNSPVYSSDSSQRSESAGADSDMSGTVFTQLPPSFVTTYASSLSDSASSSPVSAIGHAFDEAVQLHEPTQAVPPDEDVTIHSCTYSGLSVGHPTAMQTLQRGLSMQAATIKRPVSARNFSHPYFCAQRPLLKPASRGNNVSSQGSEEIAGPSTLHVRVRSGTPWSLPDAEDCQQAAQSFDITEMNTQARRGQLPAQLEWKLGQTSSARMNAASQPVDHASVTPSYSFEDGSLYRNTIVPRRLTRSATKSMAAALFAHLQQNSSQSASSPDLIPVPPILDGLDEHASDSTESKHLASQLHSLISAIQLPAAGKMVKGKPAGSVYSLSPDTPLHLLPTKKTRGRRPVVSPELNLDAEVEATMASTAEQVKFSGLTRTGKPKKIFVCRVPKCNMCFRRSEHLKRHIRSIHTNEKPFPCSHPNCGKAFARGDNLKQHQQNIHRGWTPPEIIEISPEQENSEGADDELDYSATA